jgi:hypothetical protein
MVFFTITLLLFYISPAPTTEAKPFSIRYICSPAGEIPDALANEEMEMYLMKQGKKFLDPPDDREVISNIIRTLGSGSLWKGLQTHVEGAYGGEKCLSH